MSLLGREWRIDEDNIPRLALARVTPHAEPDHQEVYALRASHLVALVSDHVVLLESQASVGV